MQGESILASLGGEEPLKLPQKRFFRQRAHCNPFSDHQLEYPVSPDLMDWTIHFPNGRQPEVLDVGCGFGGLLIALSPLFTNVNILGMEIRVKVTEYVRQRIQALRARFKIAAFDSKAEDLETISALEKLYDPTCSYENVSVARTNAMKCLPHFISKGSLSKMFFLFPDPHFKKKKHKARIITPTLLSEYAYYIREGGWVYIATDVLDLYDWMFMCLSQHPLFKQVQNESIPKNDPVINHVLYSTEEGKKVSREGRSRFFAVFERVLHPSEANPQNQL
jgi:tRNA (guanine-N7-)-methyltransferase